MTTVVSAGIGAVFRPALMPKAERRRCQRFAFHAHGKTVVAAGCIDVRLLNLSMTGALLLLPHTAPPLKSIDCLLQIHSNAGSIHQFAAMVVRRDNQGAVAVQFKALSEGALKILRRLLWRNFNPRPLPANKRIFELFPAARATRSGATAHTGKSLLRITGPLRKRPHPDDEPDRMH